MSFEVRPEWCEKEVARLTSTGKAFQADEEQVQSPDAGTCLAWSADRRKAGVVAAWQGQARPREVRAGMWPAAASHRALHMMVLSVAARSY